MDGCHLPHLSGFGPNFQGDSYSIWADMWEACVEKRLGPKIGLTSCWMIIAALSDLANNLTDGDELRIIPCVGPEQHDVKETILWMLTFLM